VAAGALHAAGGVEFWEQANEHGVSLPSAVQERKEKRRGTVSRCRRTGRRIPSRLRRNVRLLRRRDIEERNEVSETIEIDIGGNGGAIMDTEAIVYGGGTHAGVATG